MVTAHRVNVEITGWSDVRPDGAYPLDVPALLLRRSRRTLERMIADGRLKTLPRPTRPGDPKPVGPHLVLGAELLRFVGDQLTALPAPSETKLDRRKRAELAATEAARLARGK